MLGKCQKRCLEMCLHGLKKLLNLMKAIKKVLIKKVMKDNFLKLISNT